MEKESGDFERFFERTVEFEFVDSVDHKDQIKEIALELLDDSDEVLVEIMNEAIELLKLQSRVSYLDVSTLDDLISFEAARTVLNFRGYKNIPKFLQKQKGSGSEDITTSDKKM